MRQCIECGEGSGVVGVFTAKEVAEKHAEALNKDHGFTGGQHSYEIFELPDDNVMNKEYKEVHQRLAVCNLQYDNSKKVNSEKTA